MVDSQSRRETSRKLIPSCAFWAIYNKFPSQDNKLVNFVESDIDIKLRLASS